jgi:hypothetical protein
MDEEQLKAFAADVDEFLSSPESIYKYLDELCTVCLSDGDVRKALVRFESAFPDMSRLTRQILIWSDEGLDDWFNKAKIEGKKKEKILELKEKYRILKPAFVAFIFEREYLINRWDYINARHYFDYDSRRPRIEFEILGLEEEELFHTRDNIDSLYRLVRTLQDEVLRSINYCKDENITVDSELTDDLKEVAVDVKEKAEEILENINKITESFEEK